MRPSNKRSRSKQNRTRSLGNVVNRVFDSSGPEGKVRGTPQQIIDKYTVLARDAQLAGDRVAAENFLQHSEHYTRMLNEAQAEQAREAEARREQQQQQQQARRNNEARDEADGDGEGRDNGKDRRNNRRNRRDNGESRDQTQQAAPSDAVAASDEGSMLVETPESSGESQPAPAEQAKAAQPAPRNRRAPRKPRAPKAETAQVDTPNDAQPTSAPARPAPASTTPITPAPAAAPDAAE